MSSKNVKGYSLRSRLVMVPTFSAAALTLLSLIVVLVVSWRYLMSTTLSRINRMGLDLQAEYQEYGGNTQRFHECMLEDAVEHNVKSTFILLTDEKGNIRHATPIPSYLRERIAHEIAKGRRTQRLYTELSSPTDRHIALRMQSYRLVDGDLITVARDVTDMERYFIFLAIFLSCIFIFITGGIGVSSFIFATRVKHRVEAVAKTAKAIEGGKLDSRVNEEGVIARSRELADLVDAFNSMCDKNEKTVSELRVLTDNIAHDLRTPLTRLRLAAETSATGGMPNAQLADAVFDDTGKMLEMINTMLEISQTEAKIDRSPRTMLDLGHLIGQLGELYQPVVENAQQQLSVTLPDCPVKFYGHQAKLQQLVANLLDNAIKYTGTGGKIELFLKVSPKLLTIGVSDTGCGIALEDIPHVFQRFWRADSSRSLPGNGLGLALVKAIATSYGGNVYCHSELGKGSAFTVELPCELSS